MEIDKVMGERIFLTDLEPYKEAKHKEIEIIQYTGAIMKAIVSHVGKDCKHHAAGETVIFQEPIGIDLGFEGKKYRVVRETDLLFSVK